MIYVNKSKFNNLYSLYDFYNNNMKVIDASVHALSIKRLKNVEDIFFLIDPTIDELKLILDLDKEVVLMFTYLHEDYFEILKSDQVKNVLILDDLDALFLKKRAFKKFVLVTPFDLDSKEILERDYKEITHSCVCYDDISTLTYGDVRVMSSVPSYYIKTIYSGYKIIKKKSDFKKLKAIVDSEVFLKNFPLFDPLREIKIVLYTLSFNKRGYPIVAATSSAYKNIPISFSQRYYNWILSDLQAPTKDFMKNLLDPKIRIGLREKQFELFSSNFKDLPNIKDVLSEYEKTDG